MDPKSLLVPAVVVVLGWFAFGIIYNLRRGEAVLRWIQKGLPRIGERTSFRWLGSSVAELVISTAKKPFRRVETMIVLAPRDVPWLWLMAATQGRRDTLIFRAHLHNPPLVDLELADPASWTGRMALKEVTGRGWESQPYDGLTLMAPRGTLGLATSALARFAAPSQKLSQHFWRFSLRRQAPHLELHLAFPDRRVDADPFMEALQDLARAVSEPSYASQEI